jgi:uncharacterized membrane protein YeaQ/YmgE (transglycosylase-associated protein family)
MGMVWNVIVGFMAAATIVLYVPVREGTSLLLVALGVVGALLAAFAGRLLGLYEVPWGAPGLVLSTLGAFLVLVTTGLVAKRVP